MLTALQKIASRIQKMDQRGDGVPSSLMNLASVPFSRTLPTQPEQVEQALALWRNLGAELEKISALAMTDVALQMHVALGEVIWDNRKLPKGQIVQVQARNRLIALLDSRSMRAHVRPDAYPGDVEEFISAPIPVERAHIPKEFIVVPMWDLVWNYAYHHPKAWQHVPTEVSHRTLHLRRLPLSSTNILSQQAAEVIGMLINSDESFEQLLSISELPPEELMRCIVALNLSRAVQIATKSASSDSTS